MIVPLESVPLARAAWLRLNRMHFVQTFSHIRKQRQTLDPADVCYLCFDDLVYENLKNSLISFHSLHIFCAQLARNGGAPNERFWRSSKHVYVNVVRLMGAHFFLSPFNTQCHNKLAAQPEKKNNQKSPNISTISWARQTAVFRLSI